MTVERLGNPPIAVAQLEGEIAMSAIEASRYKEAIEHFERAAAAAAGTSVECDVLLQLGSAHHWQARYDLAETLLRRGLACVEERLGPADPLVAHFRMGLSETLLTVGRVAEAEVEARAALAASLQVFGPDGWDASLAQYRLGQVMLAGSRHPEALTAFEASLAAAEKSLGPDSTMVGDALNAVAVVHSEMGHSAEAIAAFERAIALREKVSGAHHPQTAQALANLGITYNDLGRPADGLPLLRRAVAIYEASEQAQSGEAVVAQSGLASALVLTGDPDAALAVLERADRFASGPGGLPLERAQVAFGRAQAYWAKGQRVRALASARDAHQLFEQPIYRKMVARWLAARGVRVD
jgi:tetratricopeptide (TPR) repeat protein